MATLYVRIPEDLKSWLDDVADRSGLTLAKTCEALLVHCREQGVNSIKVGTEVLIEGKWELKNS